MNYTLVCNIVNLSREGFQGWTVCPRAELLAQLPARGISRPSPGSTSRQALCALPSSRLKKIQAVLCFDTKLFFTVQPVTRGMNPCDLVLLSRPVGIAKYFNTKNTHYPFNPFRNLPLGTAHFSE